jgi:uncharacterized protein YbcI
MVYDLAGFFSWQRRTTATARIRIVVASNSTMALKIAQAAGEFELRRTGHAPRSVSARLTQNTLVITLHGAFTPAEKALARTPEGAATIQEFHRQLFINSSASLCEEIKRIIGFEVLEVSAEVTTGKGSVVHVFTDGTIVQVFLLAHSVGAASWSGYGSALRS